MAARAHVARDYQFGNASNRPRRDVYFRREDPVVLPRSRGVTLDLRLVGAALLATAMVTAATYGLFASDPPALGPTPEPGLTSSWTPSPEYARANALEALAGPGLATRSLAAPSPGAESDSAGVGNLPPPSETFPQSSVPVQSAPDRGPSQSKPPEDVRQDLVPSAPPIPEVIPYPNPTTTPPDGLAPPETSEAPSPALDPENPYR